MSESDSVIPEKVRVEIETTYDKIKKPKKAEEKEDKKIESVVTGEVIRRKRGVLSRIRGSFVEDGRSVGAFVIQDVAVPALRDLMFDMIRNGAERSLYGEVSVRHRSGGGGRDGRFPYDKISSNRRGSRERSSLERSGSDRREMSYKGRKNHDFGEIILETRGEAEDVLQQLESLIDRFDVATVADLYELTNIDWSFQDGKWGWYNIEGARAVKVRDGYLLQLPRTEPIE